MTAFGEVPGAMTDRLKVPAAVIAKVVDVMEVKAKEGALSRRIGHRGGRCAPNPAVKVPVVGSIRAG